MSLSVIRSVASIRFSISFAICAVGACFQRGIKAVELDRAIELLFLFLRVFLFCRRLLLGIRRLALLRGYMPGCEQRRGGSGNDEDSQELHGLSLGPAIRPASPKSTH